MTATETRPALTTDDVRNIKSDADARLAAMLRANDCLCEAQAAIEKAHGFLVAGGIKDPEMRAKLREIARLIEGVDARDAAA